MKYFKNKKIMYLLILGIICLLPMVLSPTYAKFISSYVTDNDVVEMDLSFDVGITGIDEYHEIEVSSGESLKFNVEVENASDVTAYYGVWYKMIVPSELPDDDSIQIGRLEGTEIPTSGSVDSGASKTVTLGIINNSSSSIRIYVGVASSITSTADIEYLNGKQLISGSVYIKTLLSNYVINLYNNGSTINTVNIGGSTDNPQVHLNSEQGIMLDNNGEYRYYGANPNNYVWYNDELWRIISVSNVKSSTTDTTGETRVKIVKADILSDDNGLNAFSWDSSDSTINSGYGVNDWSQADLKTELNTLYYNSTSGTCYTGQSNATTDCDFSNTGLSEEAQKLTGDAVYYLGGSSEYDGLYADDYYTFERGTTVYDCSTDDGACPRATTWTGRVGIIYPSDYAYATDLSLCTSGPHNYDDDEKCYGKDWLLYSSITQWTISPSTVVYGAFDVSLTGYVADNGVPYAGAVRPVQYLKADVIVTSGSGTSSNPYKISVAQNAITETILAPNAVSDEDIDFSKTSEESSTNGIYLRSGTEDDLYPIYYYRGDVDNNLIFADTCWKIVRTTETGGVKLIYNGVPTSGQCNNTGDSSQIGTIAFNTSYDSPAYVGYMYGTVYTYSSNSMSDITDTYYYGNDVSYADGTYTLTDTITSADWSSIYDGGLNSNHYTCFSTGTTCSSVYYIYYTNSSTAYYITLTGGKKVEDVLSEMLDYNTTSSTIKGNNTTVGTLDYWYYTNIEQKGYSNYIEDTIWCNDRSISLLNGWDPDGGSTISSLYFSTKYRAQSIYTPTLICSREIDKFTVSNSNGNGALDYPVGLLTVDEVMLAGGKYDTSNSSYYLYTGNVYWGNSPSVFSNYFATEFNVDSTGVLFPNEVSYTYGVRPSISLKFGFSIISGDGTAINPYIVE